MNGLLLRNDAQQQLIGTCWQVTILPLPAGMGYIAHQRATIRNGLPGARLLKERLREEDAEFKSQAISAKGTVARSGPGSDWEPLSSNRALITAVRGSNFQTLDFESFHAQA
jgi:hypothetical protein